ncbi:hypothetical protein [Adhaeribacter rhizoryzae]|uniref:Uncharacterized protein n=1 Tax=Adhaeribacter rhizoryzae TaxID=2607907 RepID=A0A5M6CWG5_9BACT|nr:hypothetical protein [Adhaeribacter rhizoryzae]KAA5538730.1 hypothetical protein F0145_25650 [Adhaeribacter rhizoryzae]
MRYIPVIAILILATTTIGLSQTNDSAPMTGTSILGFSLCRTTLTDIRNLAKDFKVISLEEMDLPKNCYGQDSRFTNGEGYSSEQYPGVIFQKGNQSDYVGKIRLTRDFEGKLPNGSIINMKTLKLRDVFAIYPAFKDKWNSRGCSDYWKFSNDTISFYVKIDKTIQPQFPINEKYYYDKPVEGIDLVLSCYGLYNEPTNVFTEHDNEPIFFLDSIRVNRGVLTSYEPTEIASITVFKDTTAIRILGPEGKNGVIYIYTKDYAKGRYWDYLKSKSKDYLKAVPSADKDQGVVYILDNKVLEKDFEGDLFNLTDSNFRDIKVIDKKTLKKDFKINDKNWGILIRTVSGNGK